MSGAASSSAQTPFSGWDNVFPNPGMTVAAIASATVLSRSAER
jgi:hypothetical protein